MDGISIAILAAVAAALVWAVRRMRKHGCCGCRHDCKRCQKR